MLRTFLHPDPQNRLPGDPEGRAHPSRETRAERSAVPARVCRPGWGHNGAAARCGTGSPESWARPTKTRGDRRGGPAAGSRPQGAIMGGGGDRVQELVPDSPRAGPRVRPGSSPEPVPDRPPEPAPDPPGAGPCPGAPRAAQDKSLSSQLGYARLYRLGGAPIGGDARDRALGPALRSAPLRSRPPSPSLGPGLAVVRPLAPRAWIDLVALASGSRNRPASTARLPIPGSQPARPPLALAHTRTARARCRLGILSKFPARACLRLCGPCLAASQVPKPVFLFGNVLEHDHPAHPIVLQTPFNGPTSTDPVIYRLSKWHVPQIG